MMMRRKRENPMKITLKVTTRPKRGPSRKEQLVPEINLGVP